MMHEPASTLTGLDDYARRLGIVMGYRPIERDDAMYLLPDEAAAFTKAVDKVRRQSGAARVVARRLMSQLGIEPGPIPKSSSGAPIWPEGAVGSLAHEENFAIAAVAPTGDGLSIGIDIELNIGLFAGTSALVSTPSERRIYAAELIESRQLFVIKEAVYKASFPIDGRMLDFQDVEVDLAGRRAHTRFGQEIGFAVAAGRYLIALAANRAS